MGKPLSQKQEIRRELREIIPLQLDKIAHYAKLQNAKFEFLEENLNLRLGKRFQYVMLLRKTNYIVVITCCTKCEDKNIYLSIYQQPLATYKHYTGGSKMPMKSRTSSLGLLHRGPITSVLLISSAQWPQSLSVSLSLSLTHTHRHNINAQRLSKI